MTHHLTRADCLAMAWACYHDSWDYAEDGEGGTRDLCLTLMHSFLEDAKTEGRTVEAPRYYAAAIARAHRLYQRRAGHPMYEQAPRELSRRIPRDRDDRPRPNWNKWA